MANRLRRIDGDVLDDSKRLLVVGDFHGDAFCTILLVEPSSRR
ncbi:MAG: hypothetical protein VB878_21560 [Pirellulaceae bacterium]